MGLLVSGALVVTELAAQESTALIEEIIVTATRRAESLQDAPLAVSAFTGDDLQRQGITSSHGLGSTVPNLTIGTEGARDATYIAIRGVSQNERRNTDDATTPFFIDGATVPRMSGVAAYFYDVERLEVLRGPQGTLYGRNSTTGVVNLITNKPNFDGYGGDVEVGFGDYSAFTANGALNLPLSDNFAARLAFIVQDRDGFRDNGEFVEDADDADDLGVRVHLLWNLSDETSLLLTSDHYRRQGAGQGTFGVPCPSDVTCQVGTNLISTVGDVPLAQDTSFRNVPNTNFRDNADTNFKLELNQGFETFDLIGLVSHRTHERDYGDSAGYRFDDTVRGFPVISPVYEATESESISAEVRLTSSADGPLQWLLGGYLLDERINGTFFFHPVFIGGNFAGRNLYLEFTDRDLSVESNAIFGNLTYDLTDRFTLRGGLRYTNDEKDKGGNASNPSAGSYQSVGAIDMDTGQILAYFGPMFRAQVANPSWSRTTYNVGLDYAVNDDVMVYAKFSTGYKAGGFNRGSTGPGSDPRNGVFMLDIYEPEEVDAFEVGYKSTHLGGAARVNVAAFYNDYLNKVESVVRTIDGTPVNTAINATDVEIYGVELESSFVYGDSGGRVDFNLGYLSAEYGTFDNLPDPVLGGGATLDVSGEDVLNAPNWSGSFGWVPVEFSFADGAIAPRLQVSFKSKYKTRPHGLLVDQQDAYTKTNLTVNWTSSDGAYFGEIYARNIENEIVQTNSGCGAQAQAGPAIGCYKMFSEPRTYGARIGVRF